MVSVLLRGDGSRCSVLSSHDLHTLFPEEPIGAFRDGLQRAIACGLLERVKRDVYMNFGSSSMQRDGIGRLVQYLRPNHLSYLSYESALASYGSLDQIPMRGIFATTGRSGIYETPIGTLEFQHTSRDVGEILKRTTSSILEKRRMANPSLAYEDLQRVRPRMLEDLDMEIHSEVVDELEGDSR